MALDRRTFLRGLLASPFFVGNPLGVWGAGKPGFFGDRILILIELAGGNDGLNTLVPYADPHYPKLRPTLAHPREKLLQLDEKLAFAPGLVSLFPLWQTGEVAIIPGVGYPHPNRSHFRSIDIWEGATDSGGYATGGWVNQLCDKASAPLSSFPLDAIAFGHGDGGPFAGGAVRVISMQRPEQFLKQAKGSRPLPLPAGANPALAHVIQAHNQVHSAHQLLAGHLAPTAENDPFSFPNSPLANKLKVVARLLAGGITLPLFKLSHTGFDTHSQQLPRHHKLLLQFSEAISAFKTAMVRLNLWSRVLLMTYSEFGRRAAENGSAGTDHGTAAPHFFIGGSVQGGIFGPHPALTSLTDGDLVFTRDFRSLYATVAQRWWRLTERFLDRDYPIIDCLK